MTHVTHPDLLTHLTHDPLTHLPTVSSDIDLVIKPRNTYMNNSRNGANGVEETNNNGTGTVIAAIY